MIRSACFKYFLADAFPKKGEEATFIVGLRSLVAQVLLFDCRIPDDWLVIIAEFIKVQYSVWYEQIDNKKFTSAMRSLWIWDFVDDFVFDDLMNTNMNSMWLSYSFESFVGIIVIELKFKSALKYVFEQLTFFLHSDLGSLNFLIYQFLCW